MKKLERRGGEEGKREEKRIEMAIEVLQEKNNERAFLTCSLETEHC